MRKIGGRLHSYDDHAQTKPLNEMLRTRQERLWRVFVNDLANHTTQLRPIGATAQTALKSMPLKESGVQ